MIAALQRVVKRARELVEARPAGRFLIALVHEVVEDDISGMAAEMAYRFLFAVVPLLLLTVTTLGFVADAIGLHGIAARLIEQLTPLVPSAVVEILEDVITRMLEDRSGTFFALGLIGTLWGTATGVGTLLKGLNRAYDVDRPRPVWRRQALGLVVAIILPLLALAALVIERAGHAFAEAIATLLGIGTIAAVVVNSAQIVIVTLAFFLAMSVVYHRLPNVRSRYSEAVPGALVTLCGLVLLNAGFGLYLERAAGSVAAYTTFAAAFAFLLWLYVLSFLVLVGAEVNALLSDRGRAAWNGAAEGAAK